jgi:hypothetical protein
MEAALSSKTSVSYITARGRKPEDHELKIHRFENLKLKSFFMLQITNVAIVQNFEVI